MQTHGEPNTKERRFLPSPFRRHMSFSDLCGKKDEKRDEKRSKREDRSPSCLLQEEGHAMAVSSLLYRTEKG